MGFNGMSGRLQFGVRLTAVHRLVWKFELRSEAIDVQR